MTGTPQQRNQALATWISKAGRSYQQVADEVCRLARQHRPPLNAAPDSSRVSRWVAGEQPRGIMPDLIADALTGLCRLAYSLSRADIGLATTSSGQGSSRLPWHPDAVIKAVLDMTRNDLTSQQPDPDGNALLTGDDLMEAVRPWLHQAPESFPSPTGPAGSAWPTWRRSAPPQPRSAPGTTSTAAGCPATPSLPSSRRQPNCCTTAG